MFSKFLNFFSENVEYKDTGDIYSTFIKYFGGKEFGEGLFRVFREEDTIIWERNVAEAYPQFKNLFRLFAYDWLGRCFGIDLRNGTSGHILIFEIGTNDVLEIDCELLEFLNEEIPGYSDACLASDYYKKWLRYSKKPVQKDRCIGYKIPLFLGGVDQIDNLEDSNMDVYWHIIAQIRRNNGL